MATIELDAQQIVAFRNLLSKHNIDVPKEKPTYDEWKTDQENPDPEYFLHDTACERLLWKLGNAHPLTGDPEDNFDTAYVGGTMIPASEHPDSKRERAMDSGRR